MPEVLLTSGAIEYVESGEGSPVVLLHGLLMDHRLWDEVLVNLPPGFRYIRPVLPLGAHRIPMQTDADLSMRGMVQILADFLEALDLQDVTLVHTDWGGGLFLTSHGLDSRISRLVILPCEAFDNFPPGMPGKLAALAGRVPGGIWFALRQLRIDFLRRSPLLMGEMSRKGISAELARKWTAPGIADSKIRRDLRKYATTPLDRPQLIRDTEALARFTGESLVLWSSAGKVIPREHGRRLAD
ncbi:alpha/beta fold hydrolase, partial [Rhodococcus erythropolis]